MNRFAAILLTLVAALSLGHAEEKMIRITQIDGQPFAEAAALQEIGIAIKTLPGQSAVAACHEERCVLVNGAIREGRNLLIPLKSLATALDGSLRLDEGKQTASIEFSENRTVTSPSTAKVGQLAPNFRLARLDGGAISLSDLRGKRVLINSWASW